MNSFENTYLTCATFAIGTDRLLSFFSNFLDLNRVQNQMHANKKAGDRRKWKIRENCTTFQKGPESMSNIALGVQNENIE